MKYLLILFVVLLVIFFFLGQNGIFLLGGVWGIGMGFIGLIFYDVYVVFSNVVGIVNFDCILVVVFGEQWFFFEELGVYFFVVVLFINVGIFGFGVQYFGFEGYNEQCIGFVYVCLLVENFFIGG